MWIRRNCHDPWKTGLWIWISGVVFSDLFCPSVTSPFFVQYWIHLIWETYRVQPLLFSVCVVWIASERRSRRLDISLMPLPAKSWYSHPTLAQKYADLEHDAKPRVGRWVMANGCMSREKKNKVSTCEDLGCGVEIADILLPLVRQMKEQHHAYWRGLQPGKQSFADQFSLRKLWTRCVVRGSGYLNTPGQKLLPSPSNLRMMKALSLLNPAPLCLSWPALFTNVVRSEQSGFHSGHRQCISDSLLHCFCMLRFTAATKQMLVS